MLADIGQGFLQCWYSVVRQPEPLLRKVNAIDAIFCCPALFVQAGLQLISERDDQYVFVSQQSRKPHVMWRFIVLLLYCLPFVYLRFLLVMSSTPLRF